MSTLKIAIQKSGRLHDNSLKLLKDCGITAENGNDQLKVRAQNFPLEILYLRNSDIPQYLEDGVADVAIVGDNLLVEKQKKIDPDYDPRDDIGVWTEPGSNFLLVDMEIFGPKMREFLS